MGFTYEVIVDPTRDKNEILNLINSKLLDYLSDKMYIGEPFYLSNIFNVINKVEGVIDVIRVIPEVKAGGDYSSMAVSVEELKSKDGTYIMAPINTIFEIKFPNLDIKGTAVW